MINSATNLVRNNKITKELVLKDDKNTELSADMSVENLFPPLPDSSTLLLTVAPAQFSASELARAVEDCDAHLLNMNVTSRRTPQGHFVLHIRVDRRNPAHVVRSVERFGYNVIEVDAPDEGSEADNTARDRVKQLLRILEI